MACMLLAVSANGFQINTAFQKKTARRMGYLDDLSSPSSDSSDNFNPYVDPSANPDDFGETPSLLTEVTTELLEVITALEHKHHSLEGQVQSLEAYKRDIEIRLEAASSQIKTLSSEKESVSQTLQMEKQDIENRLEATNAQIRKLAMEKEEMSNRLKSDKLRISNRLEEANSQIKILAAEKESMLNRLNRMEAANSQIQILADEKTEMAENLESEKLDIEKRLREIETRLKTANTEYQELATAKDEMKKNLESDKAAIEKRLLGTSDQVHTLAKEKEAMLTRLNRLKAASKKIQGLASEQVEMSKNLMSEKKDLEERLEEANSQILSLSTEKEDMSRKETELDAKIIMLTKERDEALAQVEEKESALDESNLKIESLEGEISNLRSDLSSVEAKLHSVIAEKDFAVEQLESLQSQREVVKERMHASMWKHHLLKIGASFDRGFSANADARREANGVVKKLERLNEEKDAYRGIEGDSTDSPLQGSWRMVWTTAYDVLVLGASPLTTVSGIYQIFDPPMVTNVIDLIPKFENLLPPGSDRASLLRAKVTTKASRDQQMPTRISLTYESVKISPIAVFGVDADFLPPIEFDVPENLPPIPGASPESSPGDFDVTYLDDEMLIIRYDDADSMFVYVKIDDEESV